MNYVKRPLYWRILQILSPHHIGACLKCGDKWWWKKPHTIDAPGHGMFPCCEECWAKMTISEKKFFVNKLCDHWADQASDYCRTDEKLRKELIEIESRREEACRLIDEGEPLASWMERL